MALLNLEQLKLFTAIIKYYKELLPGKQPNSLRFNVNREAGIGKTYILLQTSTKLEAIIKAVNQPSPIIYTTPIGIVSYNI